MNPRPPAKVVAHVATQVYQALRCDVIKRHPVGRVCGSVYRALLDSDAVAGKDFEYFVEDFFPLFFPLIGLIFFMIGVIDLT